MSVKRYAVIRHWKDNPNDFGVIEYFFTAEDCKAYIATLKKDKESNYEIAKYEDTNG